MHSPPGSLQHREAIELEFWRTDPDERPGPLSLANLTNKMSEARVLLQKLTRFSEFFEGARVILEIGAGQCWGSAIVKRLWPTAKVLACDISPDAVASAKRWQAVLGAHADEVLACRAYALPILEASVDLVWCFAAAHHFRAHRRALSEVRRVLRPGGVCLYLHEPTCARWIYGVARRRVNLKRPEVPEDVLKFGQIMKLARGQGLFATAQIDTTQLNRGPLEGIYYWALSKVRPAATVLPCTRDFVFQAPTGRPRPGAG